MSNGGATWLPRIDIWGRAPALGLSGIAPNFTTFEQFQQQGMFDTLGQQRTNVFPASQMQPNPYIYQNNQTAQTSGTGISPTQMLGGALTGLGTLGLASNLFGGGGGQTAFTSEDIDRLIASQRQSGSRRIGQQLSAANVATAGQMASRGLGSSTLTTGALQANQAAAMEAVSALESELGMTRAQAEQFLAQLQAQQEMQQQMQQQQFLGGLADIGSLLLLL